MSNFITQLSIEFCHLTSNEYIKIHAFLLNKKGHTLVAQTASHNLFIYRPIGSLKNIWSHNMEKNLTTQLDVQFCGLDSRKLLKTCAKPAKTVKYVTKVF